MLPEGTQLDRNNVIWELKPENIYTHLGIEEGKGTEQHKMKAKIQGEYRGRMKQVLKSECNARNKIAAINTLAVPVVTYRYDTDC